MIKITSTNNVYCKKDIKIDYINDGYSEDVYKPIDGYGIIYLISFSNGKFYVGQTIRSLKTRVLGHMSQSFNKNSSVYNSKIGRAVRKYLISGIIWRYCALLRLEI